jgi:thymidylate synthase (FAD)
MSLNSRSEALFQIPEAERTKPQIEELADLLALRQAAVAGTVIECLDDGFVHIVDSMGDDQAIAQAARVSYGKGTKSISDDRNLLRYLMRHRHTTPFEMVEFKFRIRCPMDTWRQWIRHRTASVNEYSTRYSEAIDSQQTTAPDAWRLQSKDNKQGSSGVVTEWPEAFQNIYGIGSPGEYLTAKEAEFHDLATLLYSERLDFGVAREQARKDLPLSTYTEAFWKIDAHNLLHFLSLRMDGHAQLEIRTYANAVGSLVKPIIPLAWEAFEDYRLNAISLSALEIEALRALVTGQSVAGDRVMGGRELKEFDAKLFRLGYIPEAQSKAA